MLDLKSLQNANYNSYNRYEILGLIYKLLKNTKFEYLHSHKGFKFFNFSNIFPVEKFEKDKEYNLIISSPNKELIKVIKSRIKEYPERILQIGKLKFEIKKVKTFDLKLKFPWKTSSPIVLRKGKYAFIYDGKNEYRVFLKNVKILKDLGFKKEKLNIRQNFKNITQEELNNLPKNSKIIKISDVYFSFEKGDNFSEWLQELKRNSIEKYKEFFNEEIEIEGNIFEEFKYKREIPIKMRIKNKEVIFIGTEWEKLNVLRKLSREEIKFYKFLLDCGLGSLNSLGFGFVNIV